MTHPTWRITRLIKKNIDDYIMVVYCKVAVSDGSFTSETMELPVALGGEATTPIDLLTEDICLQWAKNALGEDEVRRVEEMAMQQFRQQACPETSECLPWSADGVPPA